MRVNLPCTIAVLLCGRAGTAGDADVFVRSATVVGVLDVTVETPIGPPEIVVFESVTAERLAANDDLFHLLFY